MKLRGFDRIIVLLFSLYGISAITVQAHDGFPTILQNYVARVQTQFEVPGVAIAIVKDDTVILSRGYGIKKMGETKPVDDQTLFAIASNTKAFTATALGLLVEDGKLTWDAPVGLYLPWFQLSDPYVSRELTVRDLLVHRSGLGLGAGDLLWWPPSTYNRHEIACRLRFLPLATSFRSTYAYDNVLYLVAGELIETISGMSWEDFITTRILNRIGMTGSNVRHSAAGKGTNTAAPHARINGTVQVVSPFASDNTNPAGGINSSARDMSKWLIVQLDSGRLVNNDRLYSAATARQLWTLVTPIRINDPPPELPALQNEFFGYALGFFVKDYRGYKLVTHTGGLPGYLSRVTMIPALKLGVVVLTNQESSEAFDAITYFILDHYLQVPETDWLLGYSRFAKRIENEEAQKESQSVIGAPMHSLPPLPVTFYCGNFVDKWYGEMTIVQQHDKLVMSFVKSPSLIGDLQYYRYDTFICRWRDRELRADAFVTFNFDPAGKIEQISMKAVSPATDFSFDFQDLLFKPILK
jgi:CubicO group peptidase (beta-lactamase class C family)